MIRHTTYLTLVFSLIVTLIKAQTPRQVYEFSQKQFEGGNYNEALTQFERLSVLEPAYNTAYIYYYIAQCFMHTTEWDRSSQYFDLAYLSTSNDSLRIEITLTKSLLNITKHDYLLALQELFNIDTFYSQTQKNSINLLLATACFGSNRFTDAERYFVNALPNADSIYKLQLHQLFLKNKRIDRIKPGTAKFLSLVLPGLGQFYTGDIKSGTNSFLLTTAFAVIFFNTLATYTLIDAILTVGPWYFRYYFGGFNKSSSIAKERILLKRAAVYQKIISLMQEKQMYNNK